MRQQLRHVQEVLRSRWDPIGLGDDPYAQDEYDSYAGPILALLARGAAVGDVQAHLAEIVTDRMGLPIRSDVDGAVATELIAWFAAAGRVQPGNR